MLPSRCRKNCRTTAWAALLALCAGCAHQQPSIHYLGEGEHRYYRDHATEIDYPVVTGELSPELAASSPPQTIRDVKRSEVRDIPLAEAVHTALRNSEVIRRNGEFLSTGNSLLTSPDRVPSVFDPAIQESGVLFGGRGVEAALAAFDAQLTTSMIWGRNEVIQNNPFFGGGLGGGGTLQSETAQYQSSLSKNFASGGALQLNHNINYLWSNAPGVLFNSTYTGNVELLYQQPLLAGARNRVHAHGRADHAELRRHHGRFAGRADRADQQRHLAQPVRPQRAEPGARR